MSVQETQEITSNPFKQDPERELLVKPKRKTWGRNVVKALKVSAIAGSASALVNLIFGGFASIKLGTGALAVASGTGFASAATASLAGKAVKKIADNYNVNWAVRHIFASLGGYAFGWGFLNECVLFATGDLLPLGAQLVAPLGFVAGANLAMACLEDRENWGTFIAISAGTAALVSVGAEVALGKAILGLDMGVETGAIGLVSGTIVTLGCLTIVEAIAAYNENT
jgi:hypothetical protein